MIWYAIYDRKNDQMPAFLTPFHLETQSFSGIYNLHIAYCAFGYMCFGSHNGYGDSCLSDTVLNIMMIEDENVRNAVLNKFSQSTGVISQKSDDIKKRRTGADN